MLNQKSVGHFEYFKKNHLVKKIMALGFVLIALPASAATTPPSEDFWGYMQDFSDENGDVLDPIEYDQLLSMKNDDVSQSEDQDDELDDSIDAKNVRHADMKIRTRSSTQTSSSTKGEKL